MSLSQDAPEQKPDKWHWLIRLCHWSFVVLFGMSWYSAEYGLMQWHYYSGYGVIIVLIIRLLWGVVGNREARFVTFVTSPQKALQHLISLTSKTSCSDPQPIMKTHTPSGGYSVLLMLSLLTLQVLTGLFSIELEGFSGGPLSDYIDYEFSLLLRDWHSKAFCVLSAAISLHLLALVYYQKVLKIKLIRKMR